MSTTASPAPRSPRSPRAPTPPPPPPPTPTYPVFPGALEPYRHPNFPPPPDIHPDLLGPKKNSAGMPPQNTLQRQAQRPPAMGSGMRYRQQMPGSMGLIPPLDDSGHDYAKFARDAERLISESKALPPGFIGYDPNQSTTGREFLSGRDMTITQGPYSGAFEVPIGAQPQQPIIPTPVGAQPQGKMGGGYPSAPVSGSPGPVSGDPGMAGGGMTPTTQPVGVAVPVNVQPFIAGQGEFMGGGSYGAPLRGSDTMPEDYANLYGGRFGRGR